MQPAVAVVQAGYRSRFGHPALAVLARYQAAGIPVVATPSCGAWRWQSASGEQGCERERSRRYWRDTGTAPLSPDPVGPPLPQVPWQPDAWP